MADGHIVAWMTEEQADEHIAARKAKLSQLEATLKAAHADLKQAQAERKLFTPHARTGALVPPEQAPDPEGEPTENATASAGAATASGKVGR
jgi:multidrug resistance efflux pump